MTYIARHYVRVNGKMFTPGEVITERIDPAKVSRLLALGAITQTKPAPDVQPDPVNPPAPPSGDNEKQDDEDGEDDDEEEAEEEAEEAEEEAETLDIDVTDGIVNDAAPEEKPAETTRKRGKK